MQTWLERNATDVDLFMKKSNKIVIRNNEILGKALQNSIRLNGLKLEEHYGGEVDFTKILTITKETMIELAVNVEYLTNFWDEYVLIIKKIDSGIEEIDPVDLSGIIGGNTIESFRSYLDTINEITLSLYHEVETSITSIIQFIEENFDGIPGLQEFAERTNRKLNILLERITIIGSWKYKILEIQSKIPK